MPKREAIATLQSLARALRDPASAQPALRLLALPQAIRDRTPAEQTEFISKALRDEISLDGLAVLQKEGRFGPLAQIFPQEASNWAAQAGLSTTNCIAFRLDRSNGLRAEVVLAKQSSIHNPPSAIEYRIVRVNNVKQLAPLKP